MMTKKTEVSIVPSHQWTHDGEEVLIMKCVDEYGSSHGGFKHPLIVGETVVAPDWAPTASCGNGIHGWPWGIGIGDGREVNFITDTWLVYGVDPKEIVGQLENGAKCKFRTGTLRYVGKGIGAIVFTLQGRLAWIKESSSGSAAATGYRGSAAATGYSGSAAATGDSGSAAATGDRGSAAATGYRGSAAATGYSGSAAATGDSGSAAATGQCTAAIVTGIYGKAKAGEFGCIALAWWNEKEKRSEMRSANITPFGTLKPDTWYELDIVGNFVEAK